MKLEDFDLHAFYAEAYRWLLIHGTKFLLSLIVLLVGLRVITFTGTRLRGRMSRQKVHSSLQPFFLSLSLTALYVLLLVSVLAINQIDIINFSTILGGATVAIGLALSGTFQNFAGGVLILLLKPFELDDSIIAQGQDGRVTSIQIFYTVLLTADNKTVIIPNGKLFNEVIVNITREGKRRLDFEVKVGYAVDIDQVKQVILTTVNAYQTVLTNPAVRVGVISLEVDSIRFAVNVWVKPEDFLTAKMELQENIIKALKAAGVKLLGT
jgi:small conductance mechanosensitive channel